MSALPEAGACEVAQPEVQRGEARREAGAKKPQ
jgi:hypothetical protein